MTAVAAPATPLSRSQKWFVFFAMLCGMAIAGEYGITRPASNALFLTYYSAKAFPWVWLATVPLNLLVVYLYNRFLPRIGPLRMLASFALVAIIINALCALFLQSFPALIFFHFAWKDIYILLMFKQLWSMIHATISSHKAKYLYGWIFGMGTLGSVLGSLIPGFFAVQIGSEKLFFMTIPIYGFLLFSYKMALQRSGVEEKIWEREVAANPSAKEGISLIRKSPLLTAILLLVVCMQVSVALIEYQFNAHLQLTILEKDLRTAYWGKLIGLTNLISGAFQVIGGYLLIRFFGVRGSHFLIPLMLCLSALASFLMPSFAMVSFSFIFLKAIDFSFFGIAREMLYIPLRLDEKFRAKAIIDVFAYRTSKAVVSLCVLALQAVASAFILEAVSFLSILVFIAWMGVVAFLLKAPSLRSA